MKYFLSICIASYAILVLCPSCKKFTEVAPSKTSILTSEAFQTADGATAAVVGIYNLMSVSNASIPNGALTFYGGLSADELAFYATNGTTTLETEFYNDRIQKTNSLVSDMWTRNYLILGQVNTCISYLSNASALDTAMRNQLLGESQFCRGLLYFYMINLWGNVPLVLTTDWTTTSRFPRTDTALVYAEIIKDLQSAAANMSADYPTDEKVRPNKYAALALLAKVYLYRKDWGDAIATANQVLTSGLYPLANIDSVFLKTNSEAIFQLKPPGDGINQNTNEGYVFIPYPGNPPTYYLTSSLLGAFEPGDKRSTHWVDSTSYLGQTLYYPYKYKIGESSGDLEEYYTVLRSSELYLIRAEAEAEINNISGAIADLNVIRDRARDLPSTQVPDPLPALDINSTQAATLVAVAQERRIELFAEWGNRWLDLKRTGQADAVLKLLKPDWSASSVLYPIPQSEILLDALLSQNPGY